MEDPTPRLDRFRSYDEARSDFRLSIPDQFNIAASLGERHADAVTRVALFETQPGGANAYTFGGLDYLSDKFANALERCGVKEGDVIAVILPQSAPFAIASLAALKLGAALALVPSAWDLDSIGKALAMAQARAAVSSRDICEAITGSVDARFVADAETGVEDTDPHRHFWRETYTAPSMFEPAKTRARQPALITFVNRTGEGMSLIAHTHASPLAQLPAFEMFCDLRPRDISTLTIAAEWSEGGTFLGLLLPAWWYGMALVTSPGGGNRPAGVSVLPEAGLIAATCRPWFSNDAGPAEKIAPGRRIEIVDESGNALAPGTTGRLAILAEDPARPLLYSAPSHYEQVTDKAWITEHAGSIDEQGHLRLLRQA